MVLNSQQFSFTIIVKSVYCWLYMTHPILHPFSKESYSVGTTSTNSELVALA